jgi:UDP-glucuronate 4-epimerase
MSMLVTGVAGFIGFHLARRLLREGRRVVGLDNLNPYYDVELKKARLRELEQGEGAADFAFVRADLADAAALGEVFASFRPACVINLAAQAGVRYSLECPEAYVNSNLVGFANVLECCRKTGVEHLLFASSSSVYGLNAELPFCVAHNTDHPVSLYAATKKSNELMAHAYSHLFGIPCTGLRFFTVYGPWGRPDMALFSFVRDILADRPIRLFNEGKMLRDFTYIDDAIEAVVRLAAHAPRGGEPLSPGSSSAPWRICNIGNGNPVELIGFIDAIERALGKKAVRELAPMQAGDVAATWADGEDLRRLVGFSPATPPEEGIAAFVRWFREYYGPLFKVEALS